MLTGGPILYLYQWPQEVKSKKKFDNKNETKSCDLISFKDTYFVWWFHMTSDVFAHLCHETKDQPHNGVIFLMQIQKLDYHQISQLIVGIC